MPNVVTVGSNPNQAIIGSFLDQFNANRRSDEQTKMQQAQLDQAAAFHKDDNAIAQGNLGVNQGQLADLQARTAQARQIYNDTQMNERVKEIKAQIGIQHDIINTPGMDPMRKAAAEATAKQLVSNAQSDPKLKPYFDLDTVESALKSLTAEQQAKLGGDQTVANMTSRAAQGGTAPMDVNAALKVGPTQAYAPKEGFQQLQANDLAARDAAPDAAGTPTPDMSRAVPAPSGNAVSDFEARATDAMTTAPQNQVSQTQITTEGMRQTGETKREGMKIAAKQNEVDPAQVANLVSAVKGAVSRNQDPNSVLKTIKNPKLHDAVVNELAMPGQGDTLQHSINPAQQTAIREIDPLIEQAKKVLAAYAPYKDQNGLTDRDTIDYGLYMAGQKPPDDSPAAQLANLQMLRVQAGARLLKGGSRAYPALQMAMQHAGNGLTDTRANIYSKTVKLVEQLQRVRDSNAGTLGSGPTDLHGEPGNPLGLTPPGAH